MTLNISYYPIPTQNDANGDPVHVEQDPVRIEAESVEELAAKLPEDYHRSAGLRVLDEHGFTRGWIKSRTDWRAE
jgi:hypothetical protein